MSGNGKRMILMEQGAIEAAIRFLEYAEDDPDDHMEASALSLHFEHLLVEQKDQDPLWWQAVISEEMGVEAQAAQRALRDWLRELKHMKAIRRVPSHFAIERHGSYFSYLDISLGPTACRWGPLSEVHAFPSEREAREIMKICPPDARVVPAVVELVEPSIAPAAANDPKPVVPPESEGGSLD